MNMRERERDGRGKRENEEKMRKCDGKERRKGF